MSRLLRYRVINLQLKLLHFIHIFVLIGAQNFCWTGRISVDSTCMLWQRIWNRLLWDIGKCYYQRRYELVIISMRGIFLQQLLCLNLMMLTQGISRNNKIFSTFWATLATANSLPYNFWMNIYLFFGNNIEGWVDIKTVLWQYKT